LELERQVTARRLPERSIGPLFNASMGLRLRNVSYRAMADVSELVASRDLKALVDADLLRPQGEKRGRFYSGGPILIAINDSVRRRRPAKAQEDPFEAARKANEPPGLWAPAEV
jgi:hypothetical protein